MVGTPGSGCSKCISPKVRRQELDSVGQAVRRGAGGLQGLLRSMPNLAGHTWEPELYVQSGHELPGILGQGSGMTLLVFS